MRPDAPGDRNDPVRAASIWDAPPAALTLAPDEAHVWRATLDLPPAQIERLAYTLAADERARADRFRFEHLRRHFIAARGILRALLARYLDRDPRAIAFSYGPQGKPDLAVPDGDPALRFNLSHAHGLALYGFTRGREIGIDVEQIRPGVAQEAIAEHFFSPYETATLRALPVPLQGGAFFACWTRKEAYLKARGGGLSLDLAAFDVTLAPDLPAALLQTRDDPAQLARWTLTALDLGPGYAGALVVEGGGWRLRCWRWPDDA
jgi:4'-phosphopantetheinyl transferase